MTRGPGIFPSPWSPVRVAARAKREALANRRELAPSWRTAYEQHWLRVDVQIALSKQGTPGRDEAIRLAWIQLARFRACPAIPIP